MARLEGVHGGLAIVRRYDAPLCLPAQERDAALVLCLVVELPFAPLLVDLRRTHHLAVNVVQRNVIPQRGLCVQLERIHPCRL